MNKILEKLSEGDLRTTGRVDEVVEEVLRDGSSFEELFKGFYSENPGVRMRTADAVEKISIVKPELLDVYKKELLGKISRIDQQEVQWHLAQIYPRLVLTKLEVKQVVEILEKFIRTTRSGIVKVFSLQALWDLSSYDKLLRNRVEKIMDELEKNGAPSIKSRIRKLKKET